MTDPYMLYLRTYTATLRGDPSSTYQSSVPSDSATIEETIAVALGVEDAVGTREAMRLGNVSEEHGFRPRYSLLRVTAENNAAEQPPEEDEEEDGK